MQKSEETHQALQQKQVNVYTRDKQLGSNISKQFDNKEEVDSQMGKLEVTSGGWGGQEGHYGWGRRGGDDWSKIRSGIYHTRWRIQPIFFNN